MCQTYSPLQESLLNGFGRHINENVKYNLYDKQGVSIPRLKHLYHMFKTVVGQCHCWFLDCKWSDMEKQVTSSYKWLPVFTLLTINLDMQLCLHKSQTQSANLQFIINGKFYLITLLNYYLFFTTIC